MWVITSNRARQLVGVVGVCCGACAAGLAGAVVGGVLARWAVVARLVGVG